MSEGLREEAMELKKRSGRDGRGQRVRGETLE